MKDIKIALVGNPNSGKTTLFNFLTGASQHVGNWPGVTVEKKEGSFSHEGQTVQVVDLPGIYSLGAFSQDELVARDYIMTGDADVIINVIDASNIERNLYLTTQLLEMDKKIVVALNMADEAEKRQIRFNIDRLSELLAAPVISTVAHKGQGKEELIKAALDMARKPKAQSPPMIYKPSAAHHIGHVEELLEGQDQIGRAHV